MHTRVYDRIVAEAQKNEMERLCAEKETTGTDIEAAMLKFIIKERLPLSKLNSVYLKKLIQGEFVPFFYITVRHNFVHMNK